MMISSKPTVFVMLSGGVDSSVAAAELLEQDYNVVGVFMKCWSVQQLLSLGVNEDLYGCFWEEDSTDARLVAEKLGTPFYVWDLENEYRQAVVEYMLQEYKIGRTPNPDVMCNSMIKFGVFYQRARQLGADFVATGHYARIIPSKLLQNPGLETIGEHLISRGLDLNKDQSYFIWGIHSLKLDHILFPIGEFSSKTEVRAKALQLNLLTANKPDSQGLCFIGETPLRELLLQSFGQKQGQIVDQSGQILGTHPGAFLYTIGQREKLGLSGGPWFVSAIDVQNNQVVVTHADNQQPLYRQETEVYNLNWHVKPKSNFKCQAQTRYRQIADECEVELSDDQSEAKVKFHQPIRAITSGQSLVLYDGSLMLGGGIIR